MHSAWRFPPRTASGRGPTLPRGSLAGQCGTGESVWLTLGPNRRGPGVSHGRDRTLTPSSVLGMIGQVEKERAWGAPYGTAPKPPHQTHVWGFFAFCVACCTCTAACGIGSHAVVGAWRLASASAVGFGGRDSLVVGFVEVVPGGQEVSMCESRCLAGGSVPLWLRCLWLGQCFPALHGVEKGARDGGGGTPCGYARYDL